MGLAIAVGAAGALGAIARYLIDGMVQDRTSGLFPFGTFTINVIGSFVLGLVAGLVLHHTASPTVQAIVGTGFCGGLTTWSTASWETVRLVQDGAGSTALRYAVSNLAASLLAAGIGLLIFLH